MEKISRFQFARFRYRLSRLGSLLWESESVNEGEGAKSLFVSDQGRIILETYGDDAVRLRVLSSNGETQGEVTVTDRCGEERSRLPRGSRVVFDSLGRSSFSLPWRDGAVSFFVLWQGTEYLSFLFPSGARLLLQLESGTPAVTPPQELLRECERIEREWAWKRLQSAPAEELSMELAIAIRQRIPGFLPWLQDRVDGWPIGQSYPLRSVPADRELRLSWAGGLLSAGFQLLGATDGFRRRHASLDGVELREQVDYATRGLGIEESMSGLEVLQQAGSPDFAHPWIAPEYEGYWNEELPWNPEVLMRTSEFWDYYRLGGEVIRIYWEPPELVPDPDDAAAADSLRLIPLCGEKIRRLEKVQFSPADWDERLAYLVQRWRGVAAPRIVSVSSAGE